MSAHRTQLSPSPVESLENRQLLAAPDTTVLDTGFFNADTREDIVMLTGRNGSKGAGQKGTPRLVILLSQVAGGFGDATEIRFSRPGSISSVASGDFDTDGESDLLVSSYGRITPGQPGANNRRTRVHLLRGNGDGTFNRPRPVQLGGVQEARFISTANFDDDPNLDLVIASRRNVDFNGPQDGDDVLVFVLLGNGDGTFQSAQRVTGMKLALRGRVPSMKIVGGDTGGFMRISVVLLVVVAFLAALSARAAPMSEPQKIEALIKSIADLKDASFIRNGSAHSAKEAAEHLKRKWDGGKDQIKTARDFIRLAASKSSSSGKPYMIRFKDGSEKTSEAFLTEKLKALEAEAQLLDRVPRLCEPCSGA